MAAVMLHLVMMVFERIFILFLKSHEPDVVSLMSSVMVVMGLPISSVSLMAMSSQTPAVSIVNGQMV